MSILDDVCAKQDVMDSANGKFYLRPAVNFRKKKEIDVAEAVAKKKKRIPKKKLTEEDVRREVALINRMYR